MYQLFEYKKQFTFTKSFQLHPSESTLLYSWNRHFTTNSGTQGTRCKRKGRGACVLKTTSKSSQSPFVILEGRGEREKRMESGKTVPTYLSLVNQCESHLIEKHRNFIRFRVLLLFALIRIQCIFSSIHSFLFIPTDFE